MFSEDWLTKPLIKGDYSQNTTCVELQLKLHVSAYTGHLQVSTKKESSIKTVTTVGGVD